MSKAEPWLHSPKATAEIIKKYDFRFNKGFGQNFLIDSNIIKKIMDSARISEEDVVLEVGPGIGTLTQHLAYRASCVTAVEIDKRLIPVLKETLGCYDNVTIINEDILKIDIEGLILKKYGGRRIKIVANLPYYVTTPVIMELMRQSRYLSSLTVMVQKEVAERMSASAGTKSYGALTLGVNYFCSVKKIADVSANCFMPKPEVTSAVLQMDIRDEKQTVDDEELMFKTIKAAFAQRRKTLGNSLKNSGLFSFDDGDWERVFLEARIDPTTRGERLGLAEFARLSDAMGRISRV